MLKAQAPSEFLLVDRAAGRFLVNQSVFTAQEVFEREREYIFSRCWLYVGHESEIREARQFIARDVGGHSIIFVRDRTGEIHAFHNACTHRGTTLVREPCGKANSFSCPYHGWVFDTQGKLRSTAADEGYSPNFNADGFYNLKAVPRLESYRGFWFMNMNPKAISLHDYLAGAREYIDLIVDQAEGGVEVSPGAQVLINPGNWKILTDNQVDMYHGTTLHSSYFDYLADRTGGSDMAGAFLTAGSSAGTGGSAGPSGSVALGLGNGHCAIEIPFAQQGRPIAHWIPAFGEEIRPVIEEIRSGLVQRFGEARARRISGTQRNLVIFPNLVLNDNLSITLRTVYPLAPNRVRMAIWGMRTANEDPRLTAVRYANQLTFVGPGGFAHPDDFEIFELMALGNASTPNKWHDYSKGMGDEKGEDPLLARGSLMGETQQRAWWTQWDRLLRGEVHLEIAA